MLLAIKFLFARMALVHVILLYGTNNVVTTGLTAGNIQRREIGSKLVLASRIMYAAHLWTVKYSVSMFIQTLTEHIWQKYHKKWLRYLHILLAATFNATIVGDLAQCRPISHYRQVVPDPGPSCRQGYASLFTIGLLNILTNLALVVFPIPVIMTSRLTRKKKISIIICMALPICGVIFTLFQIPSVISHLGDQRFRSLLASFDILLLTFTSNAVVLGSLLQDRGYKKTKYKFDMTASDAVLNTKTPNTVGHTRILSNAWGSDEDLMRGSGGLSEVTEDDKSGRMVMVGIELMKNGSEGGRIPKKMERAKTQEIRVDETWEVQVEEALKRARRMSAYIED